MPDEQGVPYMPWMPSHGLGGALFNGWVDRHSVNCYFCGKLFDERDGCPADEWNNSDGGTVCPECLAEKTK